MPTDARPASPNPPSPPGFLADEAALKRAFDAEGPGLLTSAQSQLGEAAALAPRVVETAFVDAWHQRAVIANMEQLKAFLADDIKHGSARALSRRHSAGRFAGGKAGATTGSHEAASADPAQMWARIANGIKAGSGSADAHVAAADAGRHEAAAHMKIAARKTNWAVPVAIGVGALAIALAGAFYVNRLGEDDAVYAAVTRQGIQPIQSGPGQIGNSTLTDSTKMRMGPETRLFRPDEFPAKIRAVKVEGTAQFEVAPGNVLPFRVVAKHAQIIAPAANFVVTSYPNDTGVAILVKSGSVTVKSGKQTLPLTAGQAVIVDGNNSSTPTEPQKLAAFGWTDGQVAVEHKQLREVIAQLGRWFNLDIKVPDLKLLDRDAGFNVSLDSSKAAITQVEKSANVKFAYEGETKVFRDAGKAKK
jgi:ferric-dicitrate binding protein FerR (iron transport regulator)